MLDLEIIILKSKYFHVYLFSKVRSSMVGIFELKQMSMFVCLVCQRGYRVNDARDGCVICPRNTYSDTVDADSCTPCPGDRFPRNPASAGKISAPGSNSSSDCRKKLFLNSYRKNLFQVKELQ